MNAARDKCEKTINFNIDDTHHWPKCIQIDFSWLAKPRRKKIKITAIESIEVVRCLRIFNTNGKVFLLKFSNNEIYRFAYG